MAQARRTKKAKAKANPKRGNGRDIKPAVAVFRQGLGFFVMGAFTGILAILFWQGYNSEEQGDMGSGLKAMINQSRVQAEKRAAETIPPEPVLVDKAPRIKPKYDFYTVLPEIEEVLPKDTSDLPPPVVAVTTRSESTSASKSKPRSSVNSSAPEPKTPPINHRPLPPGSAYMLQVASYAQKADAERLKAKLALGGMRASVQKVSIEKKVYFRVRIGPYSDYGTMTSDDYKLSKMGFKAMRLRLSKAG
jgi:cell division protein FtsN